MFRIDFLRNQRGLFLQLPVSHLRFIGKLASRKNPFVEGLQPKSAPGLNLSED